jgi:hypothetical protein
MHYRRLKAALVKGEVTLGLAQQLTPLIRARAQASEEPRARSGLLRLARNDVCFASLAMTC